jgi:sec-independent protein translocase protein TatA
MLGLRMPELLLILAIVVILFGASKVPQIGAGIGQSIRDFKKALEGADDEKGGAGKPGGSGPAAPKE